MPYTAAKPDLVPSSEELRARIPGWGVDLDPADRPSVPRMRDPEPAPGAHWTLPEQQEERWPRERSIEHMRLTPAFGTSCPPKGLSGVIRKAAYARYSEARAAHWLLLMLGDRVDMVESAVTSALRGRPDNPITETGILSEPRRHGISSRFGRNRADVKHQWLDPVIVAGPWVLAGWGAVRAARRLRRGAA
ncbi:hypothetical protein [Nocardioides massiliensis]|uniref:Uncharacterized protein n=1 Tax=Nocardioides massiliensis TaxID=1325935 RepID=A0ABT9NNQ3_9ACTN|nr:hypothetical protein [Nocardioides massiliensis]MDP9821882.1 hypothetical protein [Nocardioides massiliensis]